MFTLACIKVCRESKKLEQFVTEKRKEKTINIVKKNLFIK